MKTRIVVGTRGSQLALIQTELVVSEIRKINPSLEIFVQKIVTEGDRNRHTPLPRVAGAGIFVKELEKALLDGGIDLAVHSLKDVLTEIPRGLCLLAVTERADPRDALIAKSKLRELAPGSRVGSGSLRRAVQMTHYRPDIAVCSIRGNVDTRLKKVDSGEFDGVILAAAGLRRLDWESRITEYLPLEHFLPAVGQGALAIEGRLHDKETAECVTPVNHRPTWQSVTAERAFLRALGGGCRAPIAALGTVTGSTLKLDGMVADATSQRMLRASEEGSTSSPEELGIRLAHQLLHMGASEFITGARGSGKG